MTPDQQRFIELAYAVSHTSIAAFWGCIFACWLGSFAGRLSWHGVWLFLRRSRRWRRFDRAMRKVMA